MNCLRCSMLFNYNVRILNLTRLLSITGSRLHLFRIGFTTAVFWAVGATTPVCRERFTITSISSSEQFNTLLKQMVRRGSSQHVEAWRKSFDCVVCWALNVLEYQGMINDKWVNYRENVLQSWLFFTTWLQQSGWTNL